MNRKMQSAVTKTQNRRMQIGKTDNEKAKWGSLGPRHANEIKNWCFGAIGANISRQIQIYTSIYTWIYSLSPACCKQMSFNKLKMWANWRMASERASSGRGGGTRLVAYGGVESALLFHAWLILRRWRRRRLWLTSSTRQSGSQAKAIQMQPQERQTPPDCRQLLTRLFDEVAKAASIWRWR